MLARIGLLLALFALPDLARAETPLRLGDDGFRVGQRFQEAILSPDGRFFALTGEYPDAFLLDAESGAVLQHWELTARVVSMAFGPDGSLLVLDEAGWVREFDHRSGRQRREVLVPAPAGGQPVQGVLFEGGRLVAFRAGTPDRPEIVLFDLRTGLVVPRPAARQPTWRAGSPRGRFVLEFGVLPGKQSQDAPAYYLDILDLDSGRLRHVPGLPLTAALQGIAFDEEKQNAVLVGGGRVVRVSPATGAVTKIDLKDMDKTWYAAGLVFAPNARQMVLRRGNSTTADLCEWDLTTGRRGRCGPATIPPTDRCMWTPAGRLLVWASRGRRLQPHDLHSGWTPGPDGHRAEIRCLRFVEGGREVVSADAAGRVCRWAVGTGRLLEDRLLPGGGFPCGFAARGELRVFGPLGNLSLFDIGAWRETKALDAPPAGMCWLAGDLRWWCSNDCGQVLDRDTARSLPVPDEVREWLSTAPARLLWGTATASGKRVALGVLNSVTESGETRLRFAVLPGADVRQRLDLTVTDPTPPLFSPSGLVLALCHDGKLTLFEPGVGHHSVPLPGARVALAFTPDARYLLIEATGDAGSELRLVDLATHTVRRRWLARGLLCYRAVFSPDGQRIAVPAIDGTILVLPVDLPRVPPTAPQALLRDLTSRDPIVVAAAGEALAANPGVRKLVPARIAQAVPTEPPGAALLADLDADDQEVREAAQGRLRAFSPGTLGRLEKSLSGASAEVRRALREAIEAQHEMRDPTADELRRRRVAEVLDRIGTP